MLVFEEQVTDGTEIEFDNIKTRIIISLIIEMTIAVLLSLFLGSLSLLLFYYFVDSAGCRRCYYFVI